MLAGIEQCVPLTTRDETVSDKEISYPKKQRPNEKSFFDLPPEIRNIIYKIWLTRKSAVLSLRVSRAMIPNSRSLTSSADTTEKFPNDTESNTEKRETTWAAWMSSDPELSWHINWDRASVPTPLEMQVLRVCKLLNAEGNATLFSGETAIDLRDPIGTSSLDRLHQFITDPICMRPLQWTRHIKLSLYPEISEERGRADFVATVDAAIKVLDGGSRLKSLAISIHVSDRPTKEQIESSITRLQGFRVNGSVTINQFVYGNENTAGVWEPPLCHGWAHKLLKLMKGKQRSVPGLYVAKRLPGGEEVPRYTIFQSPCDHSFDSPCYHPIHQTRCHGWKKILAIDISSQA